MKKSLAEKMYDLCTYRILGVSTHYCLGMHQYISGNKFDSKNYFEMHDKQGNCEIKNAIKNRNSSRRFSGRRMQVEEVSNLLFYGYGLKNHTGSFTVPLAGGLDVMHLTALIRMEEVWEIYFWDPICYQLKNTGYTVTDPKKMFFCRNTNLGDSSVIIVISSNLNILNTRYASRAYKFSCIHAGHIAQNILLLSTKKEYSSLVLGSLKEEEIINLCHFEEEKPLYAVILG